MAASFGIMPDDVDDVRISDLFVMIAAANERSRREWRHTLAICTMIGNVHGAFGKRSKPIDYMYDQMIGKRNPSRSKVDEWKSKIAAIKERLALEAAQNGDRSES